MIGKNKSGSDPDDLKGNSPFSCVDRGGKDVGNLVT